MPTASVKLFLAVLWSFRIVLTYKRQERLPFYVRVVETHTKKKKLVDIPQPCLSLNSTEATEVLARFSFDVCESECFIVKLPH